MSKDQKDLGTQGQEDVQKGKLNKAAGKVQKQVGKATGNKEMEAKGKAREVVDRAESIFNAGSNPRFTRI